MLLIPYVKRHDRCTQIVSELTHGNVGDVRQRPATPSGASIVKNNEKKRWQDQSLARKWFKTTAAFTAVLAAFASQAASLDYFGQPPTTDPSAYTNQPLDPSATLANIFTLDESNKGSYELPNGAY